MLVLRRAETVTLAAGGPARLLLLGGAPLDGLRHLWWNFVSSSTERIEQAKADWREGRFPPVPGETEFIPSPRTDHRQIAGLVPHTPARHTSWCLDAFK